jgi:hypothetical protein
MATIKELEIEIKDLNLTIESLEQDIRDIEELPIEERFTASQIAKSFYIYNGMEETLVNEQKADLFFSNIDKFTVEQLEAFLSNK